MKISDAEVLEVLAFFKQVGIPEPVREFRFHHVRMWRYDWAWPAFRIALEVEGGIWSGGRHNQAAGFLKDMEKYNEANALGWHVFRITPKSLCTLITVELIKRAMALRVNQNAFTPDVLAAFAPDAAPEITTST